MSGFPLPTSAVGRTIGARYRLEAVLGRGGMGVVYAGVHVHTQRPVAVKVVPYHGDADGPSRERLLLEARTAAAVRHPNVVDVLDMGADQDLLFLVLERLEGMTLQAAMNASGPFPLGRALEWLLPIMHALAALHRAGIVHRDVKPANIFLSKLDGQITPKLLDFGLARGKDDQRITNSGLVLGTPLYMSPEHASGKAVGPGADVWSLGVVLYECLAGKPPFSALDWSSLVAQITGGRAMPCHVACPELPLGVAEAIDHALVRDANVRYRSMGEMARALTQAAVEAGVGLPDELVAQTLESEANPDVPTQPNERVVISAGVPVNSGSTRPWARVLPFRMREVLWMMGILVAVGSAAAGWQAFARSHKPPAPGRDVVQTRRSPAQASRKLEPAPVAPAPGALAPIPSMVISNVRAVDDTDAPSTKLSVDSSSPAARGAASAPKRKRRRREPTVRVRPVPSQSGVETEWL